ncbi:hypothetical protein [uncultured Methanobrevibacter sp.]|uniref:hypothetical protein n=1 Tax=uncultured Methanobrevibacter sp. TaxID=253161 RepID=UPI0026218CCF
MDFHKQANEIGKIEQDHLSKLSLKERILQLLKFRQYYSIYRKEYSNVYNDFLERMESFEIKSEEDLDDRESEIYYFKKEVLSADVDLDGLNFILISLLEKYNLSIENYNDSLNLIRERYEFSYLTNWLLSLSRENLNLLEALTLITFIVRSDYWDYENMPLSYAIFDGTIDNLMERIEKSLDEDNLKALEIFMKV